MNIIQQFEAEQIAKLTAARAVPVFDPGDTLKVMVKVIEGERTRVQAYEGVCIARSNKGLNSNFTVRKISFGEGVERVFPLYSPNIDSIEVVRRGGQDSLGNERSRDERRTPKLERGEGHSSALTDYRQREEPPGDVSPDAVPGHPPGLLPETAQTASALRSGALAAT